MSKAEGKKDKGSGLSAVRVLGRLLLLLLETILLLALALYAAMYVLAKGPSPTARDQFVLSVQETSGVKFLANLFFTDEEIAQLRAARNSGEYVETDTSLININTEPAEADPAAGPVADAWGLVDDDGDGLILLPVKGEGYNGYMMVVLDPSRLIVGTIPSSYTREGYTVAEYVQHFDGVAGINAGGFLDPGGWGNGSEPDSMVVYQGQVYYAGYGLGQYGCFVGFDSQHILHVGALSRDEVVAADIQYGVCFGPALVVNGEPVDPATLASGVNPRSAIGQRSDGAVLLLVIDGRQATSLGASFADLCDIMMSYGAVNACNLDGGSSSLLWYDGAYVNNKAHIIGIRDIVTSFVVLKEGATADG